MSAAMRVPRAAPSPALALVRHDARPWLYVSLLDLSVTESLAEAGLYAVTDLRLDQRSFGTRLAGECVAVVYPAERRVEAVRAAALIGDYGAATVRLVAVDQDVLWELTPALRARIVEDARLIAPPVRDDHALMTEMAAESKADREGREIRNALLDSEPDAVLDVPVTSYPAPSLPALSPGELPATLTGSKGWAGAWSLRDLAEQPDLTKPTEEIVAGLCAKGRVTLLVAPPKAGKSTFAGFFVAQASAGADGKPKRRVLWASFEEDLGAAFERLRGFGADLDQVGLRRDWPIEQKTEELARMVADVKPDLLVIDTLASYAHGVMQDENNASQATACMKPLLDLAHAAGVSILILHHSTKSTGKYRGSSAIAATVDMIVEMTVAENDPAVRLLRPVGRWHIDDYAVVFDEQALRFTRRGPQQQQQAQAETRTAALAAKLIELARTGPHLSKTALCKAAGGKYEVARATFTDLEAKGRLVNLGDARRARWHLADAAGNLVPGLEVSA